MDAKKIGNLAPMENLTVLIKKKRVYMPFTVIVPLLYNDINLYSKGTTIVEYGYLFDTKYALHAVYHYIHFITWMFGVR